MSTHVVVASKTKAKKRYLKKKKERRKVRAKARLGTLADSDGAGEDGAEGWEDLKESDMTMEVAKVEKVKVKSELPKRSKKRRKVEEGVQEEEEEQDMDVDVDFNVGSLEEDHGARELKSPLRSQSPNFVGALPSFPLPTLPNAPSKSDLALQGLDKALVDAEVVWEGSNGPALGLYDDNEGGKLGLSGRMNRRLKELGITDLFAGASSLSNSLITNGKLACQSRRCYCLFFYLQILLATINQERGVFIPLSHLCATYAYLHPLGAERHLPMQYPSSR
jgi:ATP-dependent RNA helicase DDX51/DBP6